MMRTPRLFEARGAAAVERVLERLADVLFATEEILGVLQSSPADDWLEPVKPRVIRIYDDVNSLMKQLSR